MKYFILFNPHSNNKNGEKDAQKIKKYYPNEEIAFVDLTKVDDYGVFFNSLKSDDKLIICGGDGTLNVLINNCYDNFPVNDILFFPTGTGNDFLLDIGFKAPCPPVKINKYLENLPCVEINDNKYYFLNNVAFGIDGWVCEVANEIKERRPNAKINYTLIAISGLLGKFKPCNAKIYVDGKLLDYKKVWMSPAMNGRYMGGGMMIAPNQKRISENKKISLMCYHDAARFFIAYEFPKVFKGKHGNSRHELLMECNDIVVEYDRPTALQIDGEVISGVTKYHAYTK